jgi:hypothetical protein
MDINTELNSIISDIEGNASLYRACERLADVIEDPATPEAVRLAIIEDVANTCANVVQQIPYDRSREAITLLYPLCLSLERSAIK